MSSWRELAVLAALTVSGATLAQGTVYDGIGRPATAGEIAAWDIDVRPDFKGLPKGSGSVAKGQGVWESKCASCHGIFGESGEVFNPLVGGTTSADVETGRVARLTDSSFPGRTTLMKAAHLSTLWDYINRAMPFQAPKSLRPDEVYALTAYVLFLNDIVPETTVLDRDSIISLALPNGDGFTRQHGFGTRTGTPDVRNAACLDHCAPPPVVRSSIPDYARNDQGNLAQQFRLVGPVRGADTSIPAPVGPLAAARLALAQDPAGSSPAARTPPTLMRDLACGTCHGVEQRIVGPAFRDVARKYQGVAAARQNLLVRIRTGGSGVWGSLAMPPQVQGSEAELAVLVDWILAGAVSP